MEARFFSHAMTYEGEFECLVRTPGNEFPIQLHYHDFYEICIYLGNAGRVFLNHQQYQVRRGDIILINMFEPHTLYYNEHEYYERFIMSFTAGLLLSFNTAQSNLLTLFSPSNGVYPIYHVDETALEKYITLIHQYVHQKPLHGSDLYERALLHQLLAYVYSDCYEQITPGAEQPANIDMIARLLEYINANLSGDLSLETLSREVMYSEYYISRTFRRITGTTLTRYILEKRLSTAAAYLTAGNSISEAAYQAGFHNYSYFYKMFKKYNGIGPAEYRERRMNKISDNAKKD